MPNSAGRCQQTTRRHEGTNQKDRPLGPRHTHLLAQRNVQQLAIRRKLLELLLERFCAKLVTSYHSARIAQLPRAVLDSRKLVMTAAVRNFSSGRRSFEPRLGESRSHAYFFCTITHGDHPTMLLLCPRIRCTWGPYPQLPHRELEMVEILVLDPATVIAVLAVQKLHDLCAAQSYTNGTRRRAHSATT